MPNARRHPTRARGGRIARAVGLPVAAALVLGTGAWSAAPRFYPDDPLAREPETQDASAAATIDRGLIYDLGYNLLVETQQDHEPRRALNVNTIDEVPDSSWFTNRLGSRPVSLEELTRGPLVGAPPVEGTWTIVQSKSIGDAPGFVATDEAGETWYVSFDAPGNPEGATGALLVANKIFWALGYHQVENFLTHIHPGQIGLGPTATIRRPSGRRTRFTNRDLRHVLARAARSPDGSYRAVASRQIPGRILGSFDYRGTRPDDPNDVVPHEHRRELRALRVFGAWTNLVDMKAGNTIDTLVTRDGQGRIAHYLQDVGSTFGIGANGPRAWAEGWEYLYAGRTTLRRLLTFGLAPAPWQTVHYDAHPAVGRFEGERFEPRTWKPRVPNAAYFLLQADDAFWAARRVVAFSDEMIHAVVRTGSYSDLGAERHLAEVLIRRRDAIGRAYLTGVNPLVDFALDDGAGLTFANAAVAAAVEPAPAGYEASWAAFDNATGVVTPIGPPTRGPAPPLAVPAGLPGGVGAYVRVEVRATGARPGAAAAPASAFFRREDDGWRWVGLERQPR